jgi:hypothetical protein
VSPWFLLARDVETARPAQMLLEENPKNLNVSHTSKTKRKMPKIMKKLARSPTETHHKWTHHKKAPPQKGMHGKMVFPKTVKYAKAMKTKVSISRATTKRSKHVNVSLPLAVPVPDVPSDNQMPPQAPKKASPMKPKTMKAKKSITKSKKFTV